MTAIEIAQKVAAEHQALMFRARKDEPGQYDVKELFQGKKKGWTILDGFTASAIVKVYSALNETNRAKFTTLPLEKMASVAFKLIS
jgi:hypothetical protein